MEQITLEKGVFSAPQVVEAQNNGYIDQAQQAIGAVALTAADKLQPVSPYRHETFPDAIALLHDAQSGNTEAFGELYRQHYGPISRYVGARMRDRDRDAVPDLVHDAFCEAFANLSSAPEDVTGWFFRLAAKACTRYSWSNRRYIRAALTVGEETYRTPNDQSATSRPEHFGRISFAHALSRLAPDQRRAIQLRFLDELPRQARAEALGRSLDALKSLEHRALRNLRHVLAWTAIQGNGVEPLTSGTLGGNSVNRALNEVQLLRG